MLAGVTLSSALVQAADATTAAAAGGGEGTSMIKAMVDNGGWTMDCIFVLSFLAVVLAFYFLLTLRRGLLVPETFRREAEEVAERGDIEALATICRENNSPAARIIGAGAQILKTNPDADYMVLRDIIDSEGGRQASALWQRIQYLQDIAVVSPMFGLLGTVLGMIDAFVSMQGKTGIGAIHPESLATGVSMALLTTAGGLMVGIPAMMLYAYFRGRVNNLVGQLEETSSQILQRIIFKAQGRSDSSKVGKK